MPEVTDRRSGGSYPGADRFSGTQTVDRSEQVPPPRATKPLIDVLKVDNRSGARRPRSNARPAELKKRSRQGDDRRARLRRSHQGLLIPRGVQPARRWPSRPQGVPGRRWVKSATGARESLGTAQGCGANDLRRLRVVRWQSRRRSEASTEVKVEGPCVRREGQGRQAAASWWPRWGRTATTAARR